MPDKRSHRGPHPEDRQLFGPPALPMLRAAAGDYVWLLNRGYAGQSALKLVGDRYGLTRRQRVAVARSACSDEAVARRRRRAVEPHEVAGRRLLLDGFNVLVTIEAALAGGVVLCGRDGCFRDMASMHGTYRKVSETLAGLELIGQTLASLGTAACCWYLDSPVSNSGRLRATALELAAARGWPWQIELVHNPDRMLSETDEIIATSDSAVMETCQRWINLARIVVERYVPDAWIVDFEQGSHRSR